MAPRASWTGRIRLGEIAFGVKLYAAATTSDAGGSSPAFQAFDDAIADVVERRANTVSRMLSEGATTPFIIAVLTALAGLGATVAVWRGISRRLEEYS